MSIGQETITVQRAFMDPGVGEAGHRHARRERDWSDPAEWTVKGCSLQPYQATEDGSNREFTETHARLFGPYSMDLASTDRVVHLGVTYEVDGEPARWRDDDGMESHTEATLKRLTG